MKNDVKLRALCRALEIDTDEMMEIFELEGMTVTEEFAEVLLGEMPMVEEDDDTDESAESVDSEEATEDLESEELAVEVEKEIETPAVVCDNPTLETFLNGYITYRRGAPEAKDGVVEKRALVMTSPKNVNNTMLKKLKIALSLTNEDVIDILSEVNLEVSKGELTPLFRKEGHKHYKRCSDQMLMAFIDGVGVMTHA